jgi:hypothetical protein
MLRVELAFGWLCDTNSHRVLGGEFVVGLLNKSLIEQSSLQMAFIAIASRIVGSAFRCLETLNPEYQKSKIISDPRTVCIRELSTICMACCFALMANKLIKPFALKRGWGNFRVQFLTTVIGTTIAESIGRWIAYRKRLGPANTALEPYVPGVTQAYRPALQLNPARPWAGPWAGQNLPLVPVNRTGLIV